MKYALLVHQPKEVFERRDDKAAIAAGRAYGEALEAAGIFVAGAGLDSPQTSTTVSVRDGKRHVHDGPYAETKEFLAGFGIIDVPNLDAALERWPAEGGPEKPEAWLLHVARNRMIDAVRRSEVRQKSEKFLQQIAEEAQAVAKAHEHFPDERLKLLFVCAHPAIDPAARTPLMLQAVLGIDAARIASAFLVSPVAMSQRLVRAKNKIRDAGIPFRVPEPPEEEERVSFVLDAIYAAYTTGWESLMETASTHHALATEAVTLGRMLTHLMPREPEALGLLALILHCEARREARYTNDRKFVPLDQQDTALWSQSMIEEAEKHLRSAAAFKHMGRYQLEAAIQSVHASRAKTGRIDWKEIALLYEGLVRIAPGIGSLVGRAVAIAQ